MARVRSPNYPLISLPEAIARTKTIHDKERHMAAPKEVLAKHLGYSGLNGASIKTLSAVAKYGLLEEVGDAALKVSPLAISILYPSNTAEKADAIRTAALGPPIFQEIVNNWSGEVPSKENLTSWLIRRNFTQDAIDKVIENFTETSELVAREAGGYSAASAPGHPPGATRPEERPAVETTTRQHTPAAPGGGGNRPVSVTWMGDRVEVSASLTDAASIYRLIKALEAQKALLPEEDEKGG
jgi:hypothetical protein